MLKNKRKIIPRKKRTATSTTPITTLF